MSEPATPPVEVDPAALCPSCSRFVGPKRRCPHCGAGIHTRLSLRLFQGGSVLIAVLGLFFLYLWARSRDITEVRIGEIVETMNMAYVRVEGTVGSVSARRDEKGRLERLGFEIDDGTGVARVWAFRHAAGALEKRGRIPRRGDGVTMAGSVRTEPGGQVSLTIQTADHVQLRQAEAVHVPLGELSQALLGKTVSIEGKVRAVYEPREGSRGPYSIRLRDGDDDASLVVWPRNWPLLESRGLKVGANVLARVTVGEHRGKIQLQLEDGEDLRVEAAPPSATQHEPEPGGEKTLEPGAVGRSQLGRALAVTGVVERIEPAPPDSRRPHSITLVGGGGRLVVVLWGDDFEGLAAAGLEEGSRLAVRGILSEYRGTLQLKPGGAGDVTILAKRPAEEGELPGVVGPGGVRREWMGRIATVRGEVSEVERKRSGIKIVLSEGGAELEVFVKKALASAVPELDALGRGGRVRVRGPVSEYGGRLQVNPARASDLTVEEGGVRLPQARKAASLSPSDGGSLVLLTGAWTRLETLPKGTKAILDDGSGKTVAVVVWDDVKNAMRDPEEVLQVGRRVQVIGQVSEYRGELQVVPQAGWDVIAKD